MTQTRFEMILTVMAFAGGSGCWLYAWTLCGPRGKTALSLGAYHWLGRHGRHVGTKTREVPTYDGEPVRHVHIRNEDQRIREYAALRREAEAIASVSAAPLIDFTDELKRLTESDAQPAVPPELAALQEVVRLHEELAQVEASYAQRIAAAIRRANPSDATQEMHLQFA